jgi:hypothetical protein
VHAVQVFRSYDLGDRLMGTQFSIDANPGGTPDVWSIMKTAICTTALGASRRSRKRVAR